MSSAGSTPPSHVSRRSQLAEEFRPNRLFPALIAGLIVGLIEVIFAVSFSTLLLPGEAAHMISRAVGLALLGATLSGIVIALFATLRGTIGGNQDVPAAILGVVIAAVLEGGAAGPWSLAALLVATVGTLVGVRVFAISNETFGLAEVPVNAWFVDLASAAIFVLISPLGTTLGSSPTGDGLAFGATVVGLTLIVAAVLAAVVMSDFENALRGSVELARPKVARASRMKRTGDSSAT